VLLGDGLPASALVVEASKVPGLMNLAGRAALPPGAPAPLVAAAIDFVLEGLYAQKRIGRSEAGGYVGTEPQRKPQTVRQAPAISLDEDDEPGGPPKKKRYYN
jgi:magnesium chelatase subunit I